MQIHYLEDGSLALKKPLNCKTGCSRRLSNLGKEAESATEDRGGVTAGRCSRSQCSHGRPDAFKPRSRQEFGIELWGIPKAWRRLSGEVAPFQNTQSTCADVGLIQYVCMHIPEEMLLHHDIQTVLFGGTDAAGRFKSTTPTTGCARSAHLHMYVCKHVRIHDMLTMYNMCACVYIYTHTEFYTDISGLIRTTQNT